MTREEAYQKFSEWRNLGFGHSTMLGSEVLVMAMKSLRPITREQVEKVWRGCRSCKGCRSCVYSIHDLKDMPCKKCDPNAEGILTEYKPSNFCPACGKPLTDEAVDMVMERLEALHSETKTD